MKILLALLVILPCALGQTVTPTTISGPLYDATGGLSTCGIYASPQSVPNASVANVAYQVVSGDLTGANGGYGNAWNRITNHSPLTLFYGTYKVIVQCGAPTYGSHTYLWRVPPNGTFDINRLNFGPARRLGEITTTLGNTPATIGAQ